MTNLFRIIREGLRLLEDSIIDENENGCFQAFYLQLHQYEIVVRALPTEKNEQPKIYMMKLWTDKRGSYQIQVLVLLKDAEEGKDK
ncbi:hypothetical protein ISN44_As07g006970 [Arabidopsis suecica]|uniref:Uncharacterized protein n=1 Tax=Arabidopsis suecica TaxID=45249 RepID=A0A8T2BQU0_ARASU|nr:hypothetical protein ISN44_As07g006970 [Arabidopsis suecica]